MGFIVPAVGRTLAQKMLLQSASGTTCRPPSYIGSGTGTAAVADGDTGLDSEIALGTIARVSSSNTEPSATVHQGSAQITYPGAYDVWEAGWFTSTAAYPASNIYARGTLADKITTSGTGGDKITFTFQVQYNQG